MVRFHKGIISDTRWKVFTIKNDRFVEIGEVFVSGEEVAKEMAEHRSIIGYESMDLAKRIAYKKFPKANPVIVERIWNDNFK